MAEDTQLNDMKGMRTELSEVTNNFSERCKSIVDLKWPRKTVAEKEATVKLEEFLRRIFPAFNNWAISTIAPNDGAVIALLLDPITLFQVTLEHINLDATNDKYDFVIFNFLIERANELFNGTFSRLEQLGQSMDLQIAQSENEILRVSRGRYGPQWNVWNGMIGMNRDIISKLAKIVGLDKTRAMLAMCYQSYLWRKSAHKQSGIVVPDNPRLLNHWQPCAQMAIAFACGAPVETESEYVNAGEPNVTFAYGSPEFSVIAAVGVVAAIKRIAYIISSRRNPDDTSAFNSEEFSDVIYHALSSIQDADLPKMQEIMVGKILETCALSNIRDALRDPRSRAGFLLKIQETTRNPLMMGCALMLSTSAGVVAQSVPLGAEDELILERAVEDIIPQCRGNKKFSSFCEALHKVNLPL